MQKSQHRGFVHSQTARLHWQFHHTLQGQVLLLRNSFQITMSYLDEQAQVDVVGLWPGPADLAVLLVTDVDTL